jgi:hypothetical protein
MPRKPGAPDDLRIDAHFDDGAPEDIGDYLQPKTRSAPANPQVHRPPVRVTVPQELPSPAPRPARPRVANTRLELSISAEHKSKLETLAEHARTYSVQKDISVAEIISALVELAHDALGEINYPSVRPRGAWGSATSRALKSALAHDYSLGIVAHLRKESRG